MPSNLTIRNKTKTPPSVGEASADATKHILAAIARMLARQAAREHIARCAAPVRNPDAGENEPETER